MVLDGTVINGQIVLEPAQPALPEGAKVRVELVAEPTAAIRAPATTMSAARESPTLGTLKGTILYLAPHFDQIPEGFEEYLP